MESRVAAIITAAGSSTRFNLGGSAVKKEYRLLSDGITVLGAAVSAFVECKKISVIIITVPANAENGEAAARAAIPVHFFENASCTNALPKIYFVPGGNSRSISVHNALNFLATFDTDSKSPHKFPKPDYVLIHDGARPWLSSDLINKTIDAVFLYDAVIPVCSLTETPKELDGSGFVARHLKRAKVVSAQTPQAFEFTKILGAHERARNAELQNNIEWTDDAEIWGQFVGKCAVIEGEKFNRKITFADDVQLE